MSRSSITRARSPSPAYPDRQHSTSLGAILWVWHERWRQRRTLEELEAHLLKDIGVGKAEARREAAKPFWRG